MNTKPYLLTAFLVLGNSLSASSSSKTQQADVDRADSLFDVFEDHFARMHDMHQHMLDMERAMLEQMEKEFSLAKSDTGPKVESFSVQPDKSGNNLVATLKVAGLTDADRDKLTFDVNVEHNVLTVSGTIRTQKDDKERKHAMESSFTMVRTLQARVDENNIKASFNKKDGVLTVTMPKRDAVKIEVVNE